MGCNCKTTETIIKIHKQYGNKINVSWKKKIRYNISELIMLIIKTVILFIIFPIILIIIIFRAFRGKTNINITNFLNILLKKK